MSDTPVVVVVVVAAMVVVAAVVEVAAVVVVVIIIKRFVYFLHVTTVFQSLASTDLNLRTSYTIPLTSGIYCSKL